MVRLHPTWFRVHKNGWDIGRTELKKFRAAAGKFILVILNQPDGNFLQQTIRDTLPVNPVDQSQYFIQITESQPVYYFLIATPLFTLSGFLTIVRMVEGLVGPQIFSDLGIF